MTFVNRASRSLAHLEWRIRLFGAGAIMAMIGIWTDQGWLIDIAIGVLVIGFALRFGRRKAGDPESDVVDPDVP